MIDGVGVDVIEVDRLRETIERHGEHFLMHVYCPEEQQDAPTGEGRPAFYAGRWAAKEAVAKALGTGIGKNCAWTDVCVVRNRGGAPEIVLRGAALRTAKARGITKIHISISHERRIACASAVSEKSIRVPA